MMRIVLTALVLLNWMASGSELFAQSNQVTNPVPLTPPNVNTTTTNCQISCDTQAMNCQSSCVPITGSLAANPLTPAG